MKLRDKLLNALSTLPGSRTFHLHVLFSSPRKYGGLYPYATPSHAPDRTQHRKPPRVYAQDIMVLVAEESSATEGKRILVAAVEATAYTIPATRSMVLAIVKVDSTGHGSRPAPTTSIVRALIAYFVDPTTRPDSQGGTKVERVWVHLFARAQGQYLFPGSSEWKGKKVLSGEKLCKWWRAVLGGVSAQCSNTGADTGERLWWLLPGMSELEALQVLGELPAGSSRDHDVGRSWIYGHPYSQNDVPLPYVPIIDGNGEAIPYNLGHYIPSFDDDPKTRFLDEVACTTKVDGVLSPRRKRSKTGKHTDAASSSQEGRDAEEQLKERDREERPYGELGKVRPDEFWERMSFRQECISGAVTGFFVAVFPWASLSRSGSDNPLAPQPGHVSFQMNRRMMMALQNTDFSSAEGAIRGTEIVESAIRGMCEGTATGSTGTGTDTVSASTRLEPGDLPPPPKVNRRTPEREAGSQHLAPPRTPPPQAGGIAAIDDISPNPFPEPEASSDTYHSFIYGSISIDKPVQEVASSSNATAATGVVTELAVRKKVRKK